MAVLARTVRAGALMSTPFLVLAASEDHGWGRFLVGSVIAVVSLVCLRRSLIMNRERRHP